MEAPVKVKRMFVVGRRDRRATTVVMLKGVRSPFCGPWSVKAMVIPR